MRNFLDIAKAHREEKMEEEVLNGAADEDEDDELTEERKAELLRLVEELQSRDRRMMGINESRKRKRKREESNFGFKLDA